ncbi:GNAT family N-acetyltransferase [Roseateles sp.]|uniref:GNAT family N-acetyltransferase n=1 Tax=Roseateles sp. TaxID=1971397 RepID=UPI00286A644F|nr:GNAT family N-acetyltransferase [Roseateles sp.]
MTRPTFTWNKSSATHFHTDAVLQAAWDQLNCQRGSLPFLDASAISAALSNFGNGREIVLTGYLREQIVAIFILSKIGRLQWATFQPSQLPLGAWVGAAQVDLYDLVHSLMRGPLGFCLAVSVTQIDPLYTPRSITEPHSDARQSSDYRIDDYISTASIDIKGSFEEYWAARGKNLRQNLRKQRNKLTADGVVATMNKLTDAAAMAQVLARYGALESAGWKADRGTAIHPNNAQGRFYLSLFELAGKRGEALVYEYLLNDRTVAINLGLLRAGQLIVLKTAYDESIKTLSPAFLLREEELQAFFGEGHVQRIEYYGKVMDWHTKLTQETRTLYHLTVYRWAWLQAWLTRRQAKAKIAQATAVQTSVSEPAVNSTPVATELH